MNKTLRLVVAVVLAALAAPVASRAEDLNEGAVAELASPTQDYKASFCSAAHELRDLKQLPCTSFGDFNQKDLIAAAKAVFGEASTNANEQCAVAQTIFNRARDEGKHLASIVAAPGQFEGYSTSDRLECDKLKGSVAAVRVLATGHSCSFGARGFKYFCSISGWNRVKNKRKSGSEQPEFIGNTAFLTKGPC